MAKRPQALKSFYIMAHNNKRCYKCPYCILSCRDDLMEKNLEHPFEYNNNIPPPIKTLPVSINNYFGDPFLQPKDTFKKLKILEKAGHKGVVVIITKSYISPAIISALKNINLKLQILYSISSTKDNFDGISYNKKIESLERLIANGIVSSLYYRPIISGINDSKKMIETILKDYKRIGGDAFSYAGLMGKGSVISLLKMNNYNPKIPKGYNVWLDDKKIMPEDKREFLESKAKELGLLPFIKTSCLVSYKAGLSHDYNNHFYKPSNYKCLSCAKYKDCKAYKESLTEKGIGKVLEGFGIVFNKTRRVEAGICPSIKQCSHPTKECRNMNSIVIDVGTITQGDESVLKWVSGAMVNAKEIIKSPEVTIIDHLL